MKNQKKNEYKGLAKYYDYLVTSGYYDYEATLHSLLSVLGSRTKVLDLGIGTAILAERLMAARSEILLTGIDFSPDMLQQARHRLSRRARLYEANVVDFNLGEIYENAFSNGGIWNFIKTKEQLALCSHIVEKNDNERGFQRVADHLCSGGQFVLSVQDEHHNMEMELANKIHYRQIISHHKNGFLKKYYFERDDDLLAYQEINFRLFSLEEANEMIFSAGFKLDISTSGKGLHVFRKY
jgi:SAM-dependent methyltransferase